MPARKASAQWSGDLKTGKGYLNLGSGLFDAPYGFANRFGDAPGTNPEELVGAGLASCFTMALSADLGREGFTPENLSTEASVDISQQGGGFVITHIDLTVSGKIEKIDANKFAEIAEGTKKNCPVAKALAGTTINLKTTLV